MFPCRTNGKEPLVAGGFKAATIDPEQIRRWWMQWPDANVAMPTGVGTFDVLDVDVRATGDGWRALRRLKPPGCSAGSGRS